MQYDVTTIAEILRSDVNSSDITAAVSIDWQIDWNSTFRLKSESCCNLQLYSVPTESIMMVHISYG
jgi:hypothetical protein